MVCSRVQNLLSAFTDRELTGVEMLSIQRHLDGCPECYREHQALLHVKRLLGSLDGVQPRRPFDGDVTTLPLPAQPYWLRQAGRFLSLNVLWEDARAVLARPVGGSDAAWRYATQFVAATAIAVALVAVAAGQQRQHPDAVIAHVPAAPREEALPGPTARDPLVVGYSGALAPVPMSPVCRLPVHQSQMLPVTFVTSSAWPRR